MIIITDFYQEVIYYILIPLFIVLAIFGVVLVINGRTKKDNQDYNYRINYWSSIIGIIFGAILLSVAVGFSVSFIQRIYYYEMVNKYKLLVYFLYVFPIIPLGFLTFFISKLIKVLKNNPLNTKIED